MQLSPNFSINELTISQAAARKGIANKPGAAEIANLRRLCETILQPLRDHVGRPVLVTSGYRSPAVNRLIGGSATSAHMTGCAADIHVPGMSVAQLMNRIYQLKLPVDQCIDEFSSWIHVGIAAPGRAPRLQYLSARIQGGRTLYIPKRSF